MYSNKNFGISDLLLKSVQEAMSKTHTVPKTEKEKKLAALAEPKDKITHADVLTGRGVRKEEVEELDELSKTTLSSYAKKATRNAAVRNAIATHDERNEIDPNSSLAQQRAAKSLKDYNRSKVANRLAGVNKAVDRLTREEVEQIDELSKETLGRYVQKRVKQIPNIEVNYQMTPDEDGPMGAKRIRKFQKKINKGVTGALNRLSGTDVTKKPAKTKTNEEIEQIDEIGSMLGGIAGAIGGTVMGAGYAAHAAYKLASALKGPKSSEGIQKGIDDARKEGNHKLYHSLMAHDNAQKAVKHAKAAEAIKNNQANYHKTDNTKGKKGEMKASAQREHDMHLNNSQQYTQKAKEYTAKEKSGAPIKEERDTPGNSYEHQCAVHVKHARLGEGKTLYSQHAEPTEDGYIEWYDVMFEHGIERVYTTDVEILVSESHMNHKKKMKG